MERRERGRGRKGRESRVVLSSYLQYHKKKKKEFNAYFLLTTESLSV